MLRRQFQIYSKNQSSLSSQKLSKGQFNEWGDRTLLDPFSKKEFFPNRKQTQDTDTNLITHSDLTSTTSSHSSQDSRQTVSTN
jgi:hypothetical protein